METVRRHLRVGPSIAASRGHRPGQAISKGQLRSQIFSLSQVHATEAIEVRELLVLEQLADGALKELHILLAPSLLEHIRKRAIRL